MDLKNRIGTFVNCSIAEATYKAFVPQPLPPDPPLELTAKHHDLLEKANRALGRLDGVATLFPNTHLFLYSYVRKEALLSSQIEGTQSSFSDLLLFESNEAPGVPIDDVQEVSNYVAAMEHGLKRLHEGFPLSLRLIKEIHGILLGKGRGSNKTPGEFRRSQNWIGGTRPSNAMFVPPPPDKVMECMGLLEKFLHDDPMPTPLLIKSALGHVQFETIHSFLDGNGRLGRLLITFLLCAEKALSEPLLYLSLYFKTHRQTYYDLLQKVRLEGAWEEWLEFFLQGILETAEQAIQAAQRIMQLFLNDRMQIEKIGRATASALRVHQLLQAQPIISIATATKKLQLTKPTIMAAIKHLQRLKVVRELTGKKRHKLFVYDQYLKILDEGTEPLR